MKHKITLLTLVFALTGCIAQSDIQAKYMSQEDDCRDQAQEKLSASTKTAGDSSYILASAFSDCMNKGGWKVSVPKPPGGSTPAATNKAAATAATAATASTPVLPVSAPGTPTAGSPSQTMMVPTLPSTVATGVPAMTNSAPNAQPIIGPGVQPSPAPAFGNNLRVPSYAQPAPVQQQGMPSVPNIPSMPSQGGPSSYQPARPGDVETPDYGTGAGRNF